MRQREVGSLGEFKRLIDVRVRAREMRKAPTPAEMMLWETLRNRKILDRKFRRQFALDCLILDFYCQELKLVIELDGGIRFRARPDGPRRESRRLPALSGYGG